MSDATARSLELLSLLQTYKYWSGQDLAGRLGVTLRTLRRDVDRLRELGYRIEASRGVGGGYQLAASAQIPPLLLSDEEVVAIAVGLRGAAVAGLADSSQLTISALAKLEQVLPARLRRRVAAFSSATTTSYGDGGPRVSPEVLAQLALASRDSELLRFAYTSGTGEESRRVVEPHTLVSEGRRWYLVGWDQRRLDWRTFRADRIARLEPTGKHVPRRRLPREDAAAMIRAVATGQPQHRAEILIDVSWEEFSQQVGRWAGDADVVAGRVRWPLADARMEMLAAALLWLPAHWEYEVVGEPEFLAYLAGLGERFSRLPAPRAS